MVSHAQKILFLLLTTLLLTITAQAAAPVGQTIWIRASATGLFVSADQTRGTWAPLVADRSSVDAWEQFQVVDAGGGFIAFRSIGTGLFVSADQSSWNIRSSRRRSSRASERGSSLPGPTLPAALSRCEEERPTVLFRLISLAVRLLRSCAIVRLRECGSSLRGAQLAHSLQQERRPDFPIWFGPMSSMARQSTLQTGASTSAAAVGATTSLQNYTSRPENARIANGMLVIEARRENLGGSAYTSARMKTQGKQSFGINTWVEARINAPEGQGIWPAFWMLGNSISTVGWPSCGEIDIMEIQGQNPFRNFGTIHWADAEWTTRLVWRNFQFVQLR